MLPAITSPASPPVALTIAGSDSSAGAGVQADLKTFAAHQVYGVNALTGIVAEAPGSVSRVQPVDSTLLGAQLNRVSSAFPIHALKTGMLATADNISVVADFVRERTDTPFVVDPVMRATAGPNLLDAAGRELLKSELIPLATLVTPNLPETADLLGVDPQPLNPADAATQLFEAYGAGFLFKGGHAEKSSTVVDFACISGNLFEIPHPRLEVPDVHGTGCTLSATITARLALGQSLLEAITGGVSYLTDCLETHFSWPQSGGSESLNHFPNSVD